MIPLTMQRLARPWLASLLWLLWLSACAAEPPAFPTNFLFGTAIAPYQTGKPISELERELALPVVGEAGSAVVAASMRGTHAHDKADYGARSIVLMGNEQSGLPQDVEAACDELVRIPMMGKADSLNMASAASVMIYEVWRGQSYAGARK